MVNKKEGCRERVRDRKIVREKERENNRKIEMKKVRKKKEIERGR